MFRFAQPVSRRVLRFRHQRAGSVAVEFAVLAWPTIILLMGGIQLAIYQYTQVTLSDALFSTASDPETSVLLGNQSGYKSVVCSQIRIMPSASCISRLIVEMAPLNTYGTSAQDIDGKLFLPGTSMNLMVLRAKLPVLSLLPFLQVISAKGSVVFRRP